MDSSDIEEFNSVIARVKELRDLHEGSLVALGKKFQEEIVKALLVVGIVGPSHLDSDENSVSWVWYSDYILVKDDFPYLQLEYGSLGKLGGESEVKNVIGVTADLLDDVTRMNMVRRMCSTVPEYRKAKAEILRQREIRQLRDRLAQLEAMGDEKS